MFFTLEYLNVGNSKIVFLIFASTWNIHNIKLSLHVYNGYVKIANMKHQQENNEKIVFIHIMAINLRLKTSSMYYK